MATNKDNVVVGVFENQENARTAVNDLKNAGFPDNQIGFAVRDATGDTGTGTTTTEKKASDAGTSAVTGAVSGGILGGILGAAAALLIPGIGPVIAGGILAAALGGAAIGAAAGGIIGALVGMGVPEEEAKYYQGEFEQGRTIVTVKAGDRAQEAMNILRRNGAYDATNRQVGATTGTAYAGANYAGTNMGQPMYTGSRWEDVSPQYRTYWQQQYGNQGGRWEDYEPVYRYGWEMQNNPQYQGRPWNEIEPQLQSDWEKRNPSTPWNRISNMIHAIWDNATMGTQQATYDQPYNRP